jgi:hypothetical protein
MTVCLLLLRAYKLMAHVWYPAAKKAFEEMCGITRFFPIVWTHFDSIFFLKPLYLNHNLSRRWRG